MEALKGERRLLRGSITKASTKIKQILEGETLDKAELKSQLHLLNERFEKLEGKDIEIRTELLKDGSNCTEEELDKEQDKVDDYTSLVLKTRVLVEESLANVQCDNDNESCHNMSTCSGLQAQGGPKYKLPTLRLKEFDGDLGQWLPFWSQFEKIDQDNNMADVDKIGYLGMSMVKGSPADKLVQSYPATGEMYGNVVSALKARFGRADLLTEYYIRQLLKLILQNSQSEEKLPVAVLYDAVQSHLRNLEMLNIGTENCAAILMPLVSSCLPNDVLQIWERRYVPQLSVTNPTARVKEHLESLMLFLKVETERDQKLALAQDGFGLKASMSTHFKLADKQRQKKSVNDESVTFGTAASLVNNSQNKPTCLFCTYSHNTQDCKKGMSMTLLERRDMVNKKQACYCCLKVGHRANKCRNRPKCVLCKRSHFSIMCDTKKENERPDTQMTNSSIASCDQVLTSNAVCPILMQTLSVYVKGKQGQLKKARVLIDTGSQKSYVLHQTVNDLGYEPIRQEQIQHALFGGLVTNPTNHDVYFINVSNLDLTYSCSLEVLDQTKICGQIPTVPQGPWINELQARNIQLSDVGAITDIDILVGSDIVGKLYTGRIVELTSGLVAIETHLGWTISGKVPSVGLNLNIATIVTNLFVTGSSITDLWTLDVLGIKDPMEKTLQADIDRNTQEHFLSTVEVNKEERFEVRLPFEASHPPLSTNYDLCKKRLDSTLKKLNTEGLLGDYDRVLQGWLEKGVIERVPPEELENTGHYLPHHPVLKMESTTPVRPVFDASAKEIGKCSLNQCLQKGPNLIEKIPSCLARFRSQRIAVSGDIEKAFLQISVHPKDRDYLRFLWQNEDGEHIMFRHCRVVFGVSPSPFILEASIRLHLQNTLELAKEGIGNISVSLIEKLLPSFYVDNCVTSLNTEKEADEFISAATQIMKERQFDLRGWEKSGETDSAVPTNILGLLWDKAEDTLAINTQRLSDMKLEKITKRDLLSAAHRLFDPIGIVSSCALFPKLLLQQTWEKGLSWTAEVDEDIKNKFLKWMAEVPLLAEIKVPRYTFRYDTQDTKLTLHVFSDACKTSYAAVVFLRVQLLDEVRVCLLASKAKVAPTSKSGKGITIPRLELLAASIATRLYVTVANDYGLVDVHTTFWTDATTVLAWIQRQEPWDVFVMNRVKEIRLLSKDGSWQHVPGERNPADLPSRGCSPQQFLRSRWWEGPEWLKLSKDQWPHTEVTYNEEEVTKEKRKMVVSSMLVQEVPMSGKWYEFFSQFTKQVRMVGWIQRFISNLKYKKVNGFLPPPSDLSASEFISAEEKAILWVQREAFSGLGDSRLSVLCPFIDEKGLIRLQTKISNRDDDVNFCTPVVLPNAEHPVIRSLILEEHKKNSHVGTQTLLSLLRRNYWILGGRRTINSVLNKCLVCKRHTARRLEVEPTPLPRDRVKDARIFEVTGVDLAGPLHIKSENGTIKKMWVCLFTCAIFRAVRLELVPTLSTHGFVQALRRFISRQGRPTTMYSDNGTNFVGYDNACAELDWDSITQYSSVRKIDWRFNPPASPWWGGWWERLIGLVKSLLRRVLGCTTVDYMELQTLLCECEAVINGRPLTYLSDSPKDLLCISPSVFLHDLSETGMPEYDKIDYTPDLRKKLKYCQDLKKQLHKRFVAEYLGQLKLFSSNKKKHDLNVGDIVMVGDDNSKRIHWPVGRVVELIAGKDGKVRVVRVLTSSGVLLRPVQRLFLLESDQCCEVDDVSQPEMILDMPQANTEEQTDMTSDPQANTVLEEQTDMNTIRQYSRHGRRIRKPSRLTD